MSKVFLTHVTRLTACECDGDGDGEDMVLVDCQGASGSVSWLAALEEAPELGSVVRVSVEALS